MKISMEWLREYVSLTESAETLKEDLTMIGLLVEGVETSGGGGVLDIEVTSNRPDCLSHIGVAREVAALYGRRLEMPAVETGFGAVSGEVPFGIEIRDPELCPRYVGLLLDGVAVGESPAWMQRRLEEAGMRPLNNIVDITNYVLLETGHPLHAFDFDRLRGGKIVVGRAREGERLETLDGVERSLDGQMLLINDGERPVAIAGVMGGLDSEISPSTTRVLLEAAWFKPESVRRTSRRLGLTTEASYRFERGADWDNTVFSIARACRLIREIAGGRVAGSLKDVYPVKMEPPRIRLESAHIRQLLGVELDDGFVETTLQRLGFRVGKGVGGCWDVGCPPWRADMQREADLIEELARFHGYQNIPAEFPPSRTAGAHSPVYALENSVRGALAGQGYSEAVNLSFASPADHGEFPPPGGGERVSVANPLTEETEFLRSTLAAGLVRSAKRNFHAGRRRVCLFEIGKVYAPGPDGTPGERNTLGILGTGAFLERNWTSPEAEYGFFHLKGLLDALFTRLRIPSWETEPLRSCGWLGSADGSTVKVAGDAVGVMGSLAPELEERHKLRQPVYLAELDLERLGRRAFAPIVYESLPKFPSAERDLSIVVGKDVAWGTIERGILSLGIRELAGIRLMDVYEGEKIPAGRASLSLRFTFLDRERTLTIDRVQDFMNTVLSFLNTNYGAGIRSL
jgi:phenylalanyl-tRNA synthetase beta chain